MDEMEKKVLRRKKPLLAENVNLSPEFIKSLRDLGLLNEDAVPLIEKEGGRGNKMGKVIDLCALAPISAFDTFCFALEKDYVWLKRDLEADIRIERGAIEIDENILKESAMLVHRKFGISKRLSETDKKDIKELIAFKLQLNKEEWEKVMEKLNVEMKEEQRLNKTKDDITKALIKFLQHFVKEHQGKLTTHAHGMTSTSDAIQFNDDMASKDLLTQFDTNFKKFMRIVERILSGRALLLRERSKCLQMLQVKDTHMPLDEALEAKLKALSVPVPDVSRSSTPSSNNGDMNGLSGELRREKTETDLHVKRLNKTVSNLEHEVDEKDAHIERLKENLKNKDTEVAGIRTKMADMEAKLSEMEKKLADQQTAPPVVPRVSELQERKPRSADSVTNVRPKTTTAAARRITPSRK